MPNQTVETVKEAARAVKEVASNDAVQSKVVSILDALQNGAVEVGNTVVKYTPDVVDAALWVTRVNGMQAIANAVFTLIVAIILYTCTTKLFAWAKNVADECDGCSYVIPVVTGAVCALFSFITANVFFNIWVWIEIFNPKLYIAKQIVDHVLK